MNRDDLIDKYKEMFNQANADFATALREKYKYKRAGDFEEAQLYESETYVHSNVMHMCEEIIEDLQNMERV